MRDHGLGNPEVRQQAIALIASWIHDEPHIPKAVLERSPASIRLAHDVEHNKRPNLRDVEQLIDAYEEVISLNRETALLAAALLRCWGDAISVPAPTLLADLALGQALDPA